MVWLAVPVHGKQPELTTRPFRLLHNQHRLQNNCARSFCERQAWLASYGACSEEGPLGAMETRRSPRRVSTCSCKAAFSCEAKSTDSSSVVAFNNCSHSETMCSFRSIGIRPDR